MKNHSFIFAGQTLTFKFPVDRVLETCSYKAPVVIGHTIDQESQQFTRSPYWLQCPHLIQSINRIESRGWIQVLQDWLYGPAKAQWVSFTKDVPRLLKHSLSEEYFKVLEEEGRANIGGVQDPMRIKCLHAHYSFYAVHKVGFVGRFVHGLILWNKQRNQLGESVYCNVSNLECELGKND